MWIFSVYRESSVFAPSGRSAKYAFAASSKVLPRAVAAGFFAVLPPDTINRPASSAVDSLGSEILPRLSNSKVSSACALIRIAFFLSVVSKDR